MKTALLLITIALTMTLTSSAQLRQNIDDAKNNTRIQKSIINVPTIVCSSCVATITKTLKKVEGVREVKVDLKAKTATVTYASARVKLPKLEQAIANAGYDANSVKRNPEAYDKLDACCKADASK
jgi:copper chaperone CopZ